MDNDEEWNVFLKDHPIFTLPKSVSGPSGKGNISLELSLNTLPSFTELDPNEDGPTPSGRRQVMVITEQCASTRTTSSLTLFQEL